MSGDDQTFGVHGISKDLRGRFKLRSCFCDSLSSMSVRKPRFLRPNIKEKREKQLVIKGKRQTEKVINGERREG